MPNLSGLMSFAERAEAWLEAFHAELQGRLSRLGLPCDRPSVAALGAAMASFAMDHRAVTLHQHAPAPANYAGVMTWVALVKGHFAAVPAGRAVAHDLGGPTPGRLCRGRAGDRGAGRAGCGMSQPTGSVWWCELCQVEVWLAHHPTRRRCRLCRKWMTRTR